jgi:hypothetical protein
MSKCNHPFCKDYREGKAPPQIEALGPDLGKTCCDDPGCLVANRRRYVFWACDVRKQHCEDPTPE